MPNKLEVEQFYKNQQDPLEIILKKKIIKKIIVFIIRDWSVKVIWQVIPGVTGKFDLGVQNEGGQRLTELY